MDRQLILTGDCRDILPMLLDESVQCCVSSPPYWGLRDYGTAQWEGGDTGCEHAPQLGKSFSSGTWRTGKDYSGSQKVLSRDCQCGARRIDLQLGLEATPQEYIANMVAVFREVWRVLRDDGTLWVNMGDSYAGSSSGGWRTGNLEKNGGVSNRNGLTAVPGLKPKDLCMMPARLAMALQADGWYLRSEIVWHKPNPMPESVTDRPTKAHEMIYLLAKQERYFYDADAIREPYNPNSLDRYNYTLQCVVPEGHKPGSKGPGSRGYANFGPNGQGRNKRTIWTIATQPYAAAEAHFATFPEEIPKLCILAGSRVGDTVLDPFAGSGTVGKVALELGRKAILIELNPAYVKLAERRTFVTPGFL